MIVVVRVAKRLRYGCEFGTSGTFLAKKVGRLQKSNLNRKTIKLNKSIKYKKVAKVAEKTGF